MRLAIFFICWIGMASFVDYFSVSGTWAMLFGVIALFLSDFIVYALRGSQHELS